MCKSGWLPLEQRSGDCYHGQYAQEYAYMRESELRLRSFSSPEAAILVVCARDRFLAQTRRIAASGDVNEIEMGCGGSMSVIFAAHLILSSLVSFNARDLWSSEERKDGIIYRPVEGASRYRVKFPNQEAQKCHF